MSVKYACLLRKPLTTNISSGCVVALLLVADWYDSTRPKKQYSGCYVPLKLHI